MQDTEIAKRIARIRAEVYQDYLATPLYSLRHAMTVEEGERLASWRVRPWHARYMYMVSDEENLVGFSASEMMDPDDDCNPPGFVDGISHGYAGNTPPALFQRFRDQADELDRVATDALLCSPIAADWALPQEGAAERAERWVHVCYRLAWDHPERIGAQVDHQIFISGGASIPGPCAGRAAFDAWCRGGVRWGRGSYHFSLSRDVRLVTAGAIDFILGVGAIGNALLPGPNDQGRDRPIVTTKVAVLTAFNLGEDSYKSFDGAAKRHGFTWEKVPGKNKILVRFDDPDEHESMRLKFNRK